MRLLFQSNGGIAHAKSEIVLKIITTCTNCVSVSGREYRFT